jgi:hypothetical protein
MSLFVDLVSVIGGFASIAGVSLKDLLKTLKLSAPDAKELTKYTRFLEGRNVLFAPIDDEIQTAVIRSLEEIKRETESLRARCEDDNVHTVLLDLLLKMSKYLKSLHEVDTSTPQGKYAMYSALQGVRLDIARTLALFCTAYNIVPRDQRMQEFILNFSLRTKR